MFKIGFCLRVNVKHSWETQRYKYDFLCCRLTQIYQPDRRNKRKYAFIREGRAEVAASNDKNDFGLSIHAHKISFYTKWPKIEFLLP